MQSVWYQNKYDCISISNWHILFYFNFFKNFKKNSTSRTEAKKNKNPWKNLAGPSPIFPGVTLEPESPIQVLTELNVTWLQCSYENWYFQVDKPNSVTHIAYLFFRMELELSEISTDESQLDKWSSDDGPKWFYGPRRRPPRPTRSIFNIFGFILIEYLNIFLKNNNNKLSWLISEFSVPTAILVGQFLSLLSPGSFIFDAHFIWFKNSMH